MKQKLVHGEYGTRSNKQIYTKQNIGLSGSTDNQEDISSFEQKLKLLQQRQKNIADHYSSKISQLQDILAQQVSTKNELTKELVNLNKQSQEQRDYLGKLKVAVVDNSSVQKPISQKQAKLIASDYMIEPKQAKQQPKRTNLKSGLLASGKLSLSIQKCKSQSILGLRLRTNKVDVQSNYKNAEKNDYLLMG